MLPRFQYPSLPTSTSIRLIKLLPSHPDVLRCKMVSLNLNEQSQASPYVALSYTWGDPITIREEPVPASGNLRMPEDFAKLPFVFESECSGDVKVYNTDYAMKYYVERHPWIPRVKDQIPQIASEPIEIDGQLTYIQENLRCFLMEYRSFQLNLSITSSPTEDDCRDGRFHEALQAPIWIDALCINQNDLKERSSQVQLMDRVFRGAMRVFAWLGPPDGLTVDAIRGLHNIYESDIIAKAEEGMTLSAVPGMELIHWFAVFAFFQRSWFRRAWVTQEAIFGRERITVFFGGTMFSWERISMLVEALIKSGLHLEMLKLGRNLLKGEPLSDNTRQIRKLAAFDDENDKNADDTDDSTDATKKMLRGLDGLSFTYSIRNLVFRFRTDGDTIFTEFPPLLRVLGLFRGTDATDPRDKVFAFLNIASDARKLAIVPDYSATLQSVYRQTTETIMRKTASLSILSQVQEPFHTRFYQLPGWVPDFSSQLPYTPLDTGDDDVLFCVSGSGTETWFEIHNDDTLEVETIEVDVVMISELVGNDLDDMVLNLLKSILRIPHQYPIGDFEKQVKSPFEDSTGSFRIRGITRVEALWRTLVGNMLPNPNPGFFVYPDDAVTYPAPESLGHGFSNWIEVGILEMWYLFQNFDGDESPLSSSGARRVLTTLALWAAIYRNKHIPLTKDTIGYSLEHADLTKMAKKEKEEEEDIGFIISSQKFLPSASRLKTLLDDPNLIDELRGYDGDPQAAVNGQWREQALLHFNSDERANINSFEKRMRTMLEGRRLFTTKGGLVGVGPRSLFSERGCLYEIHIIKGAKVPYILARFDDGSYRLVGEAYVHGIMNGEIPEKMGDLDWCNYKRIRLK
ncbi:ankyrin and het domain-containing protein [Colletotrichum truncatum]|uniref:Ankyrin and het domain-containing protein n=1 Tax=Colletotrichum truncatum TaxID=5467 RepID=A0ACC3YT31_COLTU|nr:ankyrin and het domain-containing protein [Colletotrichum truncatum]KAF6785120.1 ankyrin and het domain-containing protein [Colletotrichum truncatum]